jgi:hypothetical protein
MELTYTYWQSGDFFVGFLDDYPNDSTQGRDLVELEEALAEVYEVRQDEKRHLTEIRRTGTLKIPAPMSMHKYHGILSSTNIQPTIYSKK